MTENTKTYFIYILICLLLVFAGIIFFLLLNKNQKQPVLQQSEQTEQTKANISQIPEAPFIGVASPLEICQCPKNDTWVCGEDFLNYSSKCEADCNQVKIIYEGGCIPYQKGQTIPTSCTACTNECEDNEIMFLGKDGCPSCQCQPGFENAESEYNDETEN